MFTWILLAFAFLLTIGFNKAHKESTGIDAPSRNAMRNIRRNARKKGISEAEAYSAWLHRKQKRAKNSRA